MRDLQPRTGKKTTVTATCDTDWAGCAETRRSTTCVCIDWRGFLITCFSRSQTALGLSSPEAEYYSICSAGSELIYVMGVIRFFGFEVDGWILSDSSGALSLSQRQGVGHQRHIEARYLWIQDHVQRGTFKVGKISGSLNKDVGTKHVARDDLQRHIRAMGLREWQAPDENPRDVSTIANRLSMMWPRIFSRKKHACQRNSSFLTHFAFVDCVNSDSCYCDPEVTIQSCHVFFCATTVVCKRQRCTQHRRRVSDGISMRSGADQMGARGEDPHPYRPTANWRSSSRQRAQDAAILECERLRPAVERCQSFRR